MKKTEIISFRNRTSGFTLIELIVALMVGAGFLLGLAVIFGRGLDSVRNNINTIRTYDNAKIVLDTFQTDLCTINQRMFDTVQGIYRLRGVNGLVAADPGFSNGGFDYAPADPANTPMYFDQIEFWVSKRDAAINRNRLFFISYCLGTPTQIIQPPAITPIVNARINLNNLTGNPAALCKFERPFQLVELLAATPPRANIGQFNPIADNIISLEIKYLSYANYNQLTAGGMNNIDNIDWNNQAATRFVRTWDSRNMDPLRPELGMLPALINIRIGIRYNFDPNFNNPGSTDPRQYLKFFEKTILIPLSRAYSL